MTPRDDRIPRTGGSRLKHASAGQEDRGAPRRNWSFREWVAVVFWFFLLPPLIPLLWERLGILSGVELSEFRIAVIIMFQVPMFILLFPANWWWRSPAGQPDTLIGKLLGKHLRISLRFLFFRTYLLLLALVILSTYGLIIFMWVPLLLGLFVVFQLLIRPYLSKQHLRFPLPGVALICVVSLIVAAGAVAPFRAILTATLFLVGERGGEVLQNFSGYE